MKRFGFTAVSMLAMCLALPGRSAWAETKTAEPAGPVSTSGVSRWDYITAGLTAGTGIGGNLQLFTHSWRYFRVTVVEGNIGWSFNQATLDWTIGSSFGFGGHHGRRSQFSHWFVTGAWYGEMYLPAFLSPTTKYLGLFIPAGYEFRMRWGKELRGVWGIRSFIAYSPWGRQWSGKCNPGEWLCSESTEKVDLPFIAGVTLFVGI